MQHCVSVCQRGISAGTWDKYDVKKQGNGNLFILVVGGTFSLFNRSGVLKDCEIV